MPKKGYKTVTLKDEAIRRLDSIAEELGISRAEAVEYILRKHLNIPLPERIENHMAEHRETLTEAEGEPRSDGS